ncbi:metalloprotease family protein [candidate division KSB1 bacterium]
MEKDTDNSPDTRIEITMSGLKVNIYAIVLFIPVIFGFSGIYYMIWERGFFDLSKNLFQIKNLINLPLSDINQTLVIGLFILIIGVVLHELLHGIVCAVYGKKGFKSFEFGIIWKALAPYAHCKEPLTVKAYRIVIIMPGLILGVIPSLTGIILGNDLMTLYGMIFTGVAGGDIIIFWKLRKLESGNLVQDLPDKIGCYIVE